MKLTSEGRPYYAATLDQFNVIYDDVVVYDIRDTSAGAGGGVRKEYVFRVTASTQPLRVGLTFAVPVTVKPFEYGPCKGRWFGAQSVLRCDLQEPLRCIWRQGVRFPEFFNPGAP